MSDHLIPLLALYGLKGYGISKINDIVSAAGDRYWADSIYSYLKEKHQGQLQPQITSAKEILSSSERFGLSLLSFWDDAYPEILRSIKDPPAVLYLKGNTSLLNSKCGAIVGTRKPSEYGRKSAHRIALRLASSGFTVVSGLALGVDTNAHQGALDGKGFTIAVLANGLDHIHPERNQELSENILNNGGLLISENPPYKQIYRTEFVRRNRIQSGLSLFSIVIESGEKGGSIQQAKYTHEQGRGLYAVLPEAISSSNSDYMLSGSNSIIHKYGAVPVKNRADIESIVDKYE